MLFYTFHSQDERRKFGGSAFIEMQLCKMGPEAEITQLTAVSNIDHWQNDSLYIYLDDIETFAAEYRNIFNCAIYGNLESGPADLYGINYYKPDLIETIIEQMLAKKPTDYEVPVEWLIRAKNYNGFYILGI